MELRTFRPSDAAPLTAMLHRAYAELGSRGMNFTAVDQDVATTLRRASAGASWVIEDAGRLLAAMTISWPTERALRSLTREAQAPGRAWLNQLAVDPDARGRGFASMLRDVGYRWCLDQHATSIGLDTAEPAEDLIARYERWGFAIVDRVQWPAKRYRSVVMTRTLNEP